MLKNLWMWILTNVFKIQTQTTQKEIDDNSKYALEYQRIDDIPRYVGEVAGTYPDNILLITMRGHITCSMYGCVVDSFDCRERVAEYCWIVK